jgi:hypothetical protein
VEKGVSLRTCASSVGVTPIAHAHELGHKNSHDRCTCPPPKCAISPHAVTVGSSNEDWERGGEGQYWRCRRGWGGEWRPGCRSPCATPYRVVTPHM